MVASQFCLSAAIIIFPRTPEEGNMLFSATGSPGFGGKVRDEREPSTRIPPSGRVGQYGGSKASAGVRDGRHFILRVYDDSAWRGIQVAKAAGVAAHHF